MVFVGKNHHNRPWQPRVAQLLRVFLFCQFDFQIPSISSAKNRSRVRHREDISWVRVVRWRFVGCTEASSSIPLLPDLCNNNAPGGGTTDDNLSKAQHGSWICKICATWQTQLQDSKNYEEIWANYYDSQAAKKMGILTRRDPALSDPNLPQALANRSGAFATSQSTTSLSSKTGFHASLHSSKNDQFKAKGSK